MGKINFEEACGIAEGKVTLATGKVQKARDRLANHDRQIGACGTEKLAIEDKIRAIHEDGGDAGDLDPLRQELNAVALKEQALIEERGFLERLVLKAVQKEAEATAASQATVRQRLQAEGVAVAEKLRKQIREVERLYNELENIGEGERIAKLCAVGNAESEGLPEFGWLVQVNDHDRDLLLALFDRVKKAEVEERNRKAGHPGGLVPGEYSRSQQRTATPIRAHLNG